VRMRNAACKGFKDPNKVLEKCPSVVDESDLFSYATVLSNCAAYFARLDVKRCSRQANK